MLLLLLGLLCPLVTEIVQEKVKGKRKSESETETETSDRFSLSTTDEKSETELCPEKYVIPARRKLKQYKERIPEVNRLEKKQVCLGNLIRRPPRWMRDEK